MSLKAGPSTSPVGSKTAPPGTKTAAPGVKEFTVKLARDIKKKYNVMQFNRGDKIDFSKTKRVVMDRENNMREFKGMDDDMPTHGAGSEFGRERREEARRKKFGIIARKYNPENQPWIMRIDGKPEKKYRGKKEGLITENASYYLFTQQADGTFHAAPVDSWYMFQQSIKHQTLNAEEAEEEFNRRDKTVNYFSLMVQKRLKDGTDDGKVDEEEKKKAKTKTKSLTILEDDDYRDLMSSGESSDSDDEMGGKKQKAKKKSKAPARPKKKDSGSEAEEESDTGDFEGRELDYLSEKSSDEEEEELKTDIKGLDEELQKIDDEEEELAAEEENKDEEKKEGEGDTKDGESTKKESSSSGSDSEDSDIDDAKFQSSIFMQKKNVSKKPTQQKSSKSSSRGGSRPGTPMGSENGGNKIENTLSGAANKLESPNVSSAKRPGSAEPRPAKKARTESPVPSGSRPAAPSTPEVGLTEDVVRRYLMRKPMTTKDLLYKLNPKKTGLSTEEVVKRVTMILRKLNPEKRKIKDKMYWHIKDDSKPASR